MAKQLNVNLAFNADIGNAKASIQELQGLLNKIAYSGSTAGSQNITANMQKQLREAAGAAKELQYHLNNAFNASTGNFDLSRLDKSLKTSGSNITDLSTKLLGAGDSGQQAFAKLAQSISKADRPMLRVNSQLKEMAVTLKNSARWQLSSNILHGFESALHAAVGYAKDLNRSLTDIRIVTGANTDEMAKFAEQANKAAKNLSTTTVDYTDAALIYYQQGLSDQEVQERTDITIKMANAAGVSAETVSDQLTAIWNNFDDGTKSLEYYADAIVRLGADTASSTDEIVEGVQKFASVTGTIGLSFEYATAALATITAETRESADVVGTALKTLFSRIQGLQLGKTMDDGVDLNKYSEALDKVGVKIMDASGNLKDMDVILDETASKWKNLSEAEQMALAETVAGVRQYTQFMTLMNEWDTFEDNVRRASNSTGSLQEQADIYAESWAAAEKRVKASLEGIYQDLLDDRLFISFNNGFANLLGGLDSVIEGMGGLGGVITMISGLMLTNFSNKIPAAIDNLKYNFTLLTKGAEQAYQEINKNMTEATNQAFAAGKIDPNSSQGQLIKTSNELAMAKTKLARVSEQLSAAELQQYQTELSLAEISQQALVAAKQKEEQTLQSINTTITSSKDSFNLNYANILDTQIIQPLDDATSQVSKRVSKIVDHLTFGTSSGMTQIQGDAGISSMNKIIDELIGKVSQAEGNIKKLLSGQYDVSLTSHLEYIKQAFLEAEQTADKLSLAIEGADDTAALDNVKNDINGIISTIHPAIRETNGLKKHIEAINNAANKNELKIAFSEFINQLDKAQISSKEVARVLENMIGKDNFQTLVNGYRQAAEAAAEAKQKGEEFNNTLSNFNPQHLMRTSEVLGNIGGIMTSTVSGVRSLISAFTSLGNESLSGWEKVAAFITGIGMAIPMFTSIISSYNKLNLAAQSYLTLLTIQKIGYQDTIKAITALTIAQGSQAAVLTQEQAIKLKNIVVDGAANKLTAEEVRLKLTAALTQMGVNNQTAQSAILKALEADATFLQTVAEKGYAKAIWGVVTAKMAEAAAWIVGNPLMAAGIALVAALAAGLIYLATAQKRATKAMNEANENYEEQNTKLNELKTSLQDVKKQIEELQSKGSFNVTDAEDLKRLKEQEASLERQVILQERLTAMAKREAADTYSKNINKASSWIDNAPKIQVSAGGKFVDPEQYKANFIDNQNPNDPNFNQKEYERRVKVYEDWEVAYAKFLQENQDNYNTSVEGYQAWLDYARASGKSNDEINNSAELAAIEQMQKFFYGEDYVGAIIGSMESLMNDNDQQSGKQDTNGLIANKLSDGELSTTEISEVIANFGPDFIEALQNAGITPEGYVNALAEMQQQNQVEGKDNLSKLGFNTEEMETELEQLTSEDWQILATMNIEDAQGKTWEDLLAWLEEKKSTEIDVQLNFIDTWKESYREVKAIIEDLETGDTISAEDWAKLPEEIKSAFIELDTGEYKLIDSANKIKEAFKTGFTDDLVGPIEEAVTKGEELVNTFADEGTLKVGENSSISQTTKDMTSDLTNGPGEDETYAQFQERFSDTYGIETWEYLSKVQEILGQTFTSAEEAAHAMEEFWNASDSAEVTAAQEALSKTASSVEELDEQLQSGLITLEQYNNEKDRLIVEEVIDEEFNTEEYFNDVNELTEEMLNNAEIVEELTEQYGDYAAAEKKANQLAKEAVLYQNKVNKGLQTLADNYDDWNSNLEEGNTNSDEYKDALEGIRDGLSDILDCDISEISDDLILDAEAAGILERAINGDIEAIDELQALAAKESIEVDTGIQFDGINGDMSTLYGLIDQAAAEEITVGASLETSEFGNALADMVNNSNLTADQINSIFETIGYEPIVSMERIPITSDNYGTYHQRFNIVNEKGEVQQVTAEGYSANMEGLYFEVPRINKAKTTFKGGGSSVSRPSYTPSNSSNSSGGSNKTPTYAEKKNDSDKTRYHTIQNQLEDLKDSYDRVNTAKDRAFGKDKVTHIDEEIRATDKLIAKQEEYLDAISADLPVDKAIMTAYYNSVIGGTKMQFDAEGNISNYDKIQDAMYAKYNAMTAYDEESQTWQVFEKKYEQLEKYIEQYEETYDLLRDEEKEYQDLLNQRMDLELEKIQTQIELKLNVAEDGLNLLEYQIEKLEDNASKAAEAIGLFSQKAELLYDQMAADREGLNDILGQQLSSAEIRMFYSGNMDVLNGKNFTEAQMEAIKEYRDDLLDLNGEMDEVRENIEEQVLEVFDMLNEKLQEGIDKFDNYSDTLESYRNIIDIVGEDTLGLSEKFMADLGQASVDNAINRVYATKDAYDTMIAMQQEADEKLAAARLNDDEASIEHWEEVQKQITENMEEAQSTFMSAWEDALSGLTEEFERQVEVIIEQFNNAVYELGGLPGLQEDFSQWKEDSGNTLDDYQKIYELSKLSRDIEKSIDDTETLAGKQKLKKLLEDINDLEEDGVEMSQYDLEYLQKTYDLRLAEIELEEAQRAKNTVRLSKDNEGNWSYVYTQNTDAVDAAQQKYEDALYAMQDLSSNYIDEMSEKLIATSEEMAEALSELRIQDYASIDDYYAEVERIQNEYQERLEKQQAQLQAAISNNKELYDEDWTNYANSTGYKISQIEDFATTFKDTMLGALIGSEEDTVNFTNIMQNATQGLTDALLANAQTYYANLEAAMNAAGTTTGDFADITEDNIDAIIAKSGEATEAVAAMSKNMQEEFTAISETVVAWQETYGLAMQDIINSNLAVIESFNEMLKELSINPDDITVRYNIKDGIDEVEDPAAFDTGGYTGEWGRNGKLAVLHEKELILNQADTQNLLDSMTVVKAILDTIEMNARTAEMGYGNIMPAQITEERTDVLEQIVQITAEFPDATDHDELVAAFDTLINRASQYANRKNRD